MEDEDEVVTAVDAPPPSEQQLSELPQGELPDDSEQCGAASTAGDLTESPPPVSADDEILLSTVAEGCKALAGEEEVVETVDRKEIEKEGFNVEESEPYGKEHVAADEIANVEDLPAIAEELEKKTEEVATDEIAKIEDLPPVTEELEEKNEVAGEEREIAVDGIVKVEEFPLVAEELEVKNEEDAEKERETLVRLEEEADGATPETENAEFGETEEVKPEEDEFKGEEEVAEGETDEMEDLQVNGDHSSPVVTKDDELVEEETSIADSEMETLKSGSGNGGKRKRGRNSKAAPARAPARKVVGEDVCFICLDGGDLVLCDRRGCPKAYHPSCVDHDDDFFKTKGRWNCGWHLCNTCGKNAYFMCYTCTFSLCKGCCKDTVVFCIRGNRGFCESCMKTVMMIENSEQNETGQVTFDDKSSWEYLFKDYWIEQKRKLCITTDELAQAKCPWKGSDATDKQQISIEEHDGNNDVGIDSDISLGNLEVVDSKSKNDSKSKKAKRKLKSIDSDTDSYSEKDVGTAKRKAKRRSKSQSEEAYLDSEYSSGKGDTSNKRSNRPRRLSKSRSMDGNSAGAGAANEGISTEGSVEWASKELLEFIMHMKDGDTSVLTQFDVQGLLLEYIKRNKLRDPRRRSQIICDSMLQKLFGKPRVGHFEMLKLLESHFLLKENSQADDNHGSVVDEASQLDADDNTDFLMDAGRSKGRKSRKQERGFQSNLGDYAAIDMHNINLICLRRNLMEALMEDSETFHDKVVGSFVRIRISGSGQKQDIYRLVQIIGTSKAAEPYRVGKRTTDVMLEILNLDKTEIIAIDTISNQEFTEDECKRLRQSIKCGLISRMTVGDVMEKARELQEVRVIDWLEAEIVRLSHLRDRASEKGRKKELRLSVEKLQLLKTPEERQRRLEEIPEVHSDPKMDPSCESDDESEMENKRQVSNMRPRDSGFSRRGRDHFSSRKGASVSNDSWSANARPPNKNWELNRNLSGKDFSSRREDTEHTRNNGVDKGTPRSHSWEKPRLTSDPLSTQAEYSGVRSDMSPVTPSDPKPRSDTSPVAQTDSKVSETEKMWHYRDPTSKIQGPFSMTQLRKWSNTGYFPADLRVWKTSQGEDDSILLTEVLAGRFQKELPSVGLQSDMASKISNSPSPVVASKLGRYDSSNLPSPTPMRSGSTAGWGGKQTSESKWSSGSSPFGSTNQFQGGNERLPSPTPTSPNPSIIGNKVENVGPSASVTNSTGQFLSTPGPGSSQPGAHMAHQSFAPPDAGTIKANLGPDAKNAAQGFSNASQPGTGQNPPPVYAHGWASGYVARPEMVNTVPPQLPHGQWTGAPVNNQASSYGVGYPPGPRNIASNMPPMQASHNAWRPAPTNMPWGSPQQQPVNPNMGWTVPQPPAAFVPAPMGQVPGPTAGMSAMPSGNSTVGWQGTGCGPSAGTANPGWVAPPGNTGAWNGDQNRNGGGAQWNRQSSFGSGGQRVCYFHENGHCRKGASCDFTHT